MNMQRRSFTVAAALSIAAGCNGSFVGKLIPTIRGSGVVKDETRTIEAFHALDVGSVLEVKVAVVAGAKPSLKISGDDNLVPLVESVVKDGVLVLKVKDSGNISPKLALLAEVTTDEIDRVEASGAANVKVSGGGKVDRFTVEASGAAKIKVDGLETPHAVASASGASQVTLSGTAESIKVDAAGASQVEAAELKVDDADVSVSGASGAALRVSKSVEGDVSGASRLDLHGRPEKNAVSTSGASSVNQKG